MPKPAITNFSSVAVSPSVTNQNNGLYVPQLTQAQINKIPAATLKNGAIVYNLDLNVFRIYSNNTWITINTSNGDVKGPAVSVAGNIPTFADTTGKLIQDSGLNTTITLTGGVTGIGTIGAPIAITVAIVAPSAITGYPNTTSTFLRGDGTWTNSLTGSFTVGGTSTLGNITIAANTISTIAGSVNLGQQILMNDNGLFLRNNTNYGIIYNAGIDGPQFRATGGFIWNNGVSGATELMRLTSSGNLGIGTNAPNAPLQFAGTQANRKIVLNEVANNDHQFYGLGYNANILRYQIDSIANGAHVFYVGTSSSASKELMRLTGGGNLGIGTTVPTIPLDVRVATIDQGDTVAAFGGATNQRIILIDEEAGAKGPALFFNSTDIATISGNGNIGLMQVGNTGINDLTPAAKLSVVGNAQIGFAAGGTAPANGLVVSGNVGIGKNNPATKFEVVGTSTLDGITIGGNIIDTSNGFAIGFGDNIFMNDFGVYFRNDFNHAVFYDSTVNGLQFRSFSACRWTTGVAGATELMRLTGSGNLGIGINAPNAPLQFAGTQANRKIVLYDINNNDHQFYGLGINSSIMRFQVDSTGANFVFYAGTSTSASNELMRITGGGVVRFNNLSALSGNVITSTNAIRINNDGTYTPYTGGYGFLNPSGNIGTSSGSPPLSLYCTQRILASEFNAASSKKIKNILSSSIEVEEEAINLFKKVPLFKYKYVDTISKGNATVYGIVAEELAEIIPDYVRMEDEGWIPDIFQECLIKPITGVDNQYVLFFDKDLSKPEGDRLKIIIADGENEQHIELKILDYSLKSLIVSSPSTLPETAFVYGTYGTVPTVTKNNFFELGMVVLQNCLKRIENLEAKLNN